MMVIRFNHLCKKCRKNYVLVTARDRYPVCYDCQKGELKQKIKNQKFKKLFDIPEEYYRENIFLRNIKISYIRYRNLTEKQIEAFKKVVDKLGKLSKEKTLK